MITFLPRPGASELGYAGPCKARRGIANTSALIRRKAFTS
jgi:hypothetical protein